jgi:hypothetical protein
MMLREWIFLRPIDRLYFGSTKVQTAGEVHGGRSEFPPSPYTLAGILRTHLLEGAEPTLDLDDWSPSARSQRERLVGSAEQLPSGWRILGPFPACETVIHNELPEPQCAPAQGRRAQPPQEYGGSQELELEPWLPLPAWFTYADGCLHPHRFLQFRGAGVEHEGGRPPSAPMADDDERLGSKGWWVGKPTLHSGKAEQTVRWVPASVLKRLLSATTPVEIAGEPWFLSWSRDPSRPAEPPFVKREIAPGVALDPNTGTAMDSMLYSLEMLRFKPRSGLLALLEGELQAPLRASTLTQGMGRAGRKGQAIAFEPVGERLSRSWDGLLDVEHLSQGTERSTFWIYLGTPARLDEPYSAVPAQLREMAPSGIHVVLLSIAVDLPRVIGGMAVDGGRPRDNGLYAPAGSGWLVQLSGGTAEERTMLLKRFHGRATLGPERERAFGFGLTLVGRGPEVPPRG